MDTPLFQEGAVRSLTKESSIGWQRGGWKQRKFPSVWSSIPPVVFVRVDKSRLGLAAEQGFKNGFGSMEQFKF